ncbi:uncharacterized protein J7T54_002810 [Emericellopsis cladophorae]|uniref:Uncharacterized protein n=1 Tax=Emericellopsis cladophorae TaxID=2686198 RepID=A0A9Q0BBP8_9HYPO|nr:uncharacterized protein J7T54_002810 [Emericellopsis cladophorae]KAI6779542.1 hypothetical protein J7T54_002810 [Emericellopsis cladophorae]
MYNSPAGFVPEQLSLLHGMTIARIFDVGSAEGAVDVEVSVVDVGDVSAMLVDEAEVLSGVASAPVGVGVVESPPSLFLDPTTPPTTAATIMHITTAAIAAQKRRRFCQGLVA